MSNGPPPLAVELMRRYGDIERVRRSLNHSSAAVTVLYACADTIVTRRGHRRRSWATST